MTREKITLDAKAESADGTTDQITLTIEYPEGRVMSVVGFLKRFPDEIENINNEIIASHLDDTSVMAAIMQIGADKDELEAELDKDGHD